MRMLLGENNFADLLVDFVRKTRTGFEFVVINGGWEGKVINDILYCKRGNKITPCGEVQVLSTDQELLKGDYNEVINAWNTKPPSLV